MSQQVKGDGIQIYLTPKPKLYLPSLPYGLGVGAEAGLETQDDENGTSFGHT